MAKYVTKKKAAETVQRSIRTIEVWIGEGFITGYRDPSGALLLDLDQIETQLTKNPKMRDGRKPYGPKAKIVPLPAAAVVVDGGEGE